MAILHGDFSLVQLLNSGYSKPEYDLSRYYETFGVETKNADVSTLMGVKCGSYGLENILFGGNGK
jgi:hypothetical protein